MSMNIKPINEVPFIENLSENDSLLVNSGGAAKQIAASKIVSSGGGGGSSKPIYISLINSDLSDEIVMAAAYDDEAYTSLLTFEEGAERLLSGSVIVADTGADEGVFFLTPLFFQNVNEAKASMCLVMFDIEMPRRLIVSYSDSVLD